MTTRGKARKRALDILFEAELRGLDPLDTLAVRTHDADPPVRDYTATLVEGVCAHLSVIDERITACAGGGWGIDRMPRVDRAALRIAIVEMDFLEVPGPVAISEAVRLVTELSTDDSPAYVNGLLAKALETRVS